MTDISDLTKPAAYYISGPYPSRGGALSVCEMATGRVVVMFKPDERERYRAAQADAVMPLIGPLLDAWEFSSQSVRSDHPELDKYLRKINRAMECAGDDELAAPQPTPETRVPAGYTADELDRDNPYNGWMNGVEP